MTTTKNTEYYEALSNIIERLIDEGKYNRAAQRFATETGLKMSVKLHVFGKHFQDDTQNRYIFKITLKKEGKPFTFKFGQSIANGSEEPTLYDVLTCLIKYEVGTFDDFCGNFGYDYDSRSAKKIYKLVLKEYANMERLFSTEELEILQYIC